MEFVKKLYAFANNDRLWKFLVAAALIWIGLRLLCWILGAVGIDTVARIGKYRPYYMAWIPFGQLWYEIRLTHHRHAARRAIPYLWWLAALFTASAAAGIWALNGLLAGTETLVLKLLLGAAIAAALGSLYCWVRLRILEFRSLRDYMDDPRLWAFCLVFTILGIPIQKLYFFFNRSTLS